MSIFDLNRNDLLNVLDQYTKGLDKLQSSINAYQWAYNKVYHPLAKSYGSFLVLILNIISIINIPTSFIFGWFITGGIAYVISENTVLLIIIGIPGGLLIGIAYIFLRKKIFGKLNSKYDEIEKTKYGSTEEFEILEKCEKNKIADQEYVNAIFTKYSFPQVLSDAENTKWIYSYLIKNKVTLKTAINAFYFEQERQSKMAAQAATEKVQNDQLIYAEEAARAARNAQKEAEKQTEILRQMNDRDWMRGV